MASGEHPEVRYTFKKNEKLCYRRSFDILFEQRYSVRSGRIRLIYCFDLPEALVTAPLMVAFSVPKRNFKKAVTRNLLKRRLREATRLHKAALIGALQDQDRNAALLILYNSRDTADFQSLERDVVKGLQRLESML